MKTKLANMIFPVITAVINQIKILFPFFIHSSVICFSTFTGKCYILKISKIKQFSTYQHRNKHHLILKINLYLYIIILLTHDE